MVKGILFDMDGILFDTERLYIKADKQSAGEMGLEMPDALVLRLCGAGVANTRQMVMDHFGPGFDYDHFRARTVELVTDWVQTGQLRLMDGVAETFDALDAEGIPRAVASSSEEATVRSLLALSGLAPRVQAVVSGDMVQNGKPHPEIFQTAAKALGLDAADCVAVEDSYLGVQSAAAAGCAVVMIPDVLPATDEMRALCAAVLPTMARLPGWLAAYRAG